MATTTVTKLNQSVIDRYGITEVLRSIPPSGQREVYVVVANGKTVVLKVMAFIATERLDREINICKRFDGIPGLPVFISMEVIDDKVVLVEEYIPGETLSSIAHTYKGEGDRIKLLLKNIISIMMPLWAEHEIVHRDIKPENIIIKPDDTPTIIDFGIAKDFNAASVTEAGYQPFSPFYGAPEQYSGQKELIQFTTDMFSIGVLGYTLYYGKRPFGDTRPDIEKRFQDASTPLSIPSDCPIYAFLREALHIASIERPRRAITFLNLLT